MALLEMRRNGVKPLSEKVFFERVIGTIAALKLPTLRSPADLQIPAENGMQKYSRVGRLPGVYHEPVLRVLPTIASVALAIESAKFRRPRGERGCNSQPHNQRALP